MMRGGVALRSTTDIVLLGMRLVGSPGSSFSLAVTSAIDSSGATATLNGGPTTLPGTSSSATTCGGQLLMSITVRVSGGGFFTTVATPLTSVTLLSLVDRSSCACARGTTLSTASGTTTTARRSGFMEPPPMVDGAAWSGRRRIEDQVRLANARYTASHDARPSVDGAARARRHPRGRSRNLLAAHAAAVSAQPHQSVAPRGRPRLDHRRHRRRPRRHARPVGARPRDALPSRSHGQRGLALGALEDRALVHAGGVALCAVRLAKPRRGRLRAAAGPLPSPRLRPRRARSARPARQPLSDPRARGVERVPANPRGRWDHDRQRDVSRADGPRPRAGARLPLGRGGLRADLRRSGAAEDHDQRERLVRAARAQSAAAVPRLARSLRAHGAGHARAALARLTIPRPPRAARLSARPSRRAAQRGARRPRRAAHGGGAGAGPLPARARQSPAELRRRRGARAPALSRGRRARGPARGRRRRPPLQEGLTARLRARSS